MTTSKARTIRERVGADDLDQAAALLRELAGQHEGNHLGRAINVSARLRRLRADIADGTVTQEQGTVELARIRLALLAVLDSIEEAIGRKSPAADPAGDAHTYFEAEARTARSDGAVYLGKTPMEEVARDAGKSAGAARKRVVVSYSHRDAAWLERLEVHLTPLIRTGVIDLWDDKKIRPGTRWRDEIQSAMDAAFASVLLVSADFLASSFVQDYELPRLLRRAREEGMVILPVIVGPCLFASSDLAEFQTVNDPKMPLSMNPQSEAVLVQVAESVLAVTASRN
jgi:hypothetical protein